MVIPHFFAVLNHARPIFRIADANERIPLIAHHPFKAEDIMEFGVFILAQQRGYHQTTLCRRPVRRIADKLRTCRHEEPGPAECETGKAFGSVTAADLALIEIVEDVGADHEVVAAIGIEVGERSLAHVTRGAETLDRVVARIEPEV